MGFNKFMPVRCSVCGQFIGWKSFALNEVTIKFTPDTEFTTESTEYIHNRHLFDINKNEK